jgi:hypothetical protein
MNAEKAGEALPRMLRRMPEAGGLSQAVALAVSRPKPGAGKSRLLEPGQPAARAAGACDARGCRRWEQVGHRILGPNFPGRKGGRFLWAAKKRAR